MIKKEYNLHVTAVLLIINKYILKVVHRIAVYHFISKGLQCHQYQRPVVGWEGEGGREHVYMCCVYLTIHVYKLNLPK